MGNSALFNPRRRVRCPTCGSEKLQLRSEPDRIDRLVQTPSDRMRRLFVADMQLYHCRVCRLQFYDASPTAEPAASQAPAPPEAPPAKAPQQAAGKPPEPVREKIPVSEPAAPGLSRIGRAVTIRGRLSSREDILVEGQIEGDLHLPGYRLTIGTGALLQGDVTAAEAVVLGSVEGNVDARRSIELREGARMLGDLRTPSLAVEDGAFVRGRVETA